MPDPSEFRTRKYTQRSFGFVQLKGSHNSYERGRLETQLRFNKKKPWWYGCRALEFDLHEGEGGFEWSVKHWSHDPDADFARYLATLKDWSDARSRHDVIFVTLDLKHLQSSLNDFPDVIDEYLDRVFGSARLVRPAEVHKDDAAFWPTLLDLRDRFIFCLSGESEYKLHYAHQPDRLCFADWDLGPSSQHNADWDADPRVIVNCNSGHWLNQIHGPRTPPGYVTRAWGCESQEQWNHLYGLGFSMVSMDHLRSRWGVLPSKVAFSPK